MTAIRTARAADGKFVQIANAALQDRRLSFAARGILAYVLSLPPDHHLTAEWLEGQSPTSRRDVRAALKELAALGYYRKTKKSGGKNTWIWEQVISDSPVAAEIEQDNGESAFPQVVSSDQFSSDQFSEDEKRPDKELTREDPKDVKDQKMASRQARASSGARALTDEDKIEGTRSAIAAVYGETWNQTITDEEALALYESKAPASGKVRSVEAYMAKIFDDTPDLDTLLAGLDADGSDDYDLGAEQRQAIINGDSLDPWRGTCQRCNGTNCVIGERGICAWCEEELRPDAGEGWNRAILNTVIVQLKARTGYQADDAWAARVAGHILGDAPKGTVVKNPAAYIRKTIETDPHPERFTPTCTPGVAA